MSQASTHSQASGGRPHKSRRASFSALLIPNATVFLSSFCIMVLELVAGRIVARHFGTSIYTWTSVIGVVLAGIAVGNYIGGLVADRFQARRAMATLFLLSSAAAASIAVVDARAGDSITLWRMSWQVHVAAHVALVFFIPSCFLGMISPVAATTALDAGYRRGRTIGSVYAWGVVGSILGTFATGFFLIERLDTAAIIWSVAGILAVIAIVYGTALRRTWVWAGLLCGLAMLSRGSWSWAEAIGGRLGLRQAARPNVLYSDESQYSYIEVFRVSDEPEVLGMHLDTLLHSEIEPGDPNNLRYDYERIFAAITHRFAAARRRVDTLTLGGGGYVFPRYLIRNWPGSRTDVVEIDPAVTEAAIAAFGLARDTPINCFHQDGRVFVNRMAKRVSEEGAAPPYDLIYCDALNDYLVPYQLTTREYFRNVAALLKPNGAYLINAIDILESGRFLGALVNTAETAFPFVRVFVDGGPVADLGRSRSTFVVACLLQDRNLDDPGAAYRANCRIFELDSEDMGALARRSGGVVLTDTFAPVENLLAPVFLEAAGERAAGQWIERVDSRIQSGDYDAALGLVATALRDSPGDVSLLDRKGQILRETGRHGEAISIYQSILRDRPSDVTALLGAIDTLESRGSVEEALPLFERLLELRPRDAIIRSNFGIALARCERYESAIEQFRAAIEIRPEHADAYNNWAAALSSQGRYEDAIGRYDAALRLRPDLLKAHLGRATALYRLGRFDDSLEAYRRATECDATCLPAHLNMARILESMGRFDEAEAACLRVLAMHPEEPRARQLLERIKQRTRSGD